MQVHREIERIHAAGAELCVIGNGAPSFIAGFRDAVDYRGPLYTDPTLAVYQAIGLERGVARTLDPTSLLPAVRALAAGRRQGRTQGDAWQQGGVIVIAPSGAVRYRHASRRPGDNAPVAAILAALEQA